LSRLVERIDRNFSRRVGEAALLRDNPHLPPMSDLSIEETVAEAEASGAIQGPRFPLAPGSRAREAFPAFGEFKAPGLVKRAELPTLGTPTSVSPVLTDPVKRMQVITAGEESQRAAALWLMLLRLDLEEPSADAADLAATLVE